MAAVVHAAVFYVIQAYLSQLVPWWGIWAAGAIVIGGRVWASRAATPTY
jgi:hypothetical protein